MGYQESWVYITPQRKFKDLIQAYEKAEKCGFYDRTYAEPLSVVILKHPFGKLPAGSKLLWVCGDRAFHTVGGVFGTFLRTRGKIQFIPIESVLECQGDERLRGINLNSNVPTENAFMQRFSVANYAYRLRRWKIR